jgi:hypothetical protein
MADELMLIGICPSCGKSEGVPLVYGDYEYLNEGIRAKVERGEVVCGGDAIALDEGNHVLNRACLSCEWEWYSATVAA